MGRRSLPRRCGRDGAGAADAVAVADLDEAARLPACKPRSSCFGRSRTFTSGRHRSRLETAIAQGWTLTVCTASAAGDLAHIAQAAGKRAAVQVMIDTGMTRDGIDAAAATELVGQVQSMAALRLVALGTHLAGAEEIDHPFNFEQLRRFREITDPLVTGPPAGRIKRHAANWRQSSQFPIRISTWSGRGSAFMESTRRASRDFIARCDRYWNGRAVDRHSRRGGGHKRRVWPDLVRRTSRLASVCAGRVCRRVSAMFSNRGIMMVHGRPAPVLGRISMDMTCIDLTGIATVAIGDEVTVLDADPLSVASVYGLARWADTIPYEIVRMGLASVAWLSIRPRKNRRSPAGWHRRGKYLKMHPRQP